VLGLPADNRALRRELKQRRGREALHARALQRDRRGQLRHIGAIQREIHQSAAGRWPELARFAREGMLPKPDARFGGMAAFIRAHPRYAELVQAQDRYGASEEALLEMERRLTRLDKVQRLRRLARLHGRFQTEASAADREGYQRLLSCERQGL
jgi:hypothetical protein